MGNFSQETHLEFYRRWNALAAPYFALQLKQFDGYVGRRVLDIGCGYGNFTSFMLDKDLYAGIDNDMEITVELNDKYRETPNIKFLNYDITDETCAQELRALNPDTVFASTCLSISRTMAR